MRKSSAFIGGAFLSLAAMSPALAATSTATMNVKINVTSACNVAVTDIDFGNVPATGFVAAQTSTVAMGGLFNYTCGAQAAPLPVLTQNGGANNSGSTNQMANAGLFIPYSLNIPAGGVTLPALNGALSSYQILATIPALGAVIPATGAYTDPVILTLTY